MILFLSLIATSIDNLFIGISFKLSNIKLKKKDIIELFCYSFFFLLTFHVIFNIFKVTIVSTYVKGFIFVILGLLCLKKQEEDSFKEFLTFKEKTFLIVGNSIDGLIVSLTFVKQFNYIFLSLIFAISGILFLVLGHKFSINTQKKSQWLTSAIYFSIAIFSFF